MVFGIDDLIEGATFSEIIFFLATSIFGEASVIAAGDTATTFLMNLLGEDGVIAISEIINGQAVTKSAVIEIEPEFEKLGLSLWEDENIAFQPIGGTTKEGFIQRVATIAKNMAKNGVSFATKEGRDLLNNVVKSSLDLARKGVKTALDPKILAPSVIAALGANKIYDSFRKTANDGIKRATGNLHHVARTGFKNKI